MQIKELSVPEVEHFNEEIKHLIGETMIHNFAESEIPAEYYEETLSNVKKYLSSGNAVVFAALEDERIYGWMWCHPIDRFDSHRLHIANFAVLEKARGKGVGHFLMDHVLAYADEKGFDGLDLMVTASNGAAVNLYEKYGFETERLLMRKVKKDDN